MRGQSVAWAFGPFTGGIDRLDTEATRQKDDETLSAQGPEVVPANCAGSTIEGIGPHYGGVTGVRPERGSPATTTQPRRPRRLEVGPHMEDSH